LKIRYGST